MSIDTFCDMLDEIVRLLGSLGNAMYMAFKDVMDKAADLRKNRDFMVSDFNKPKDISL